MQVACVRLGAGQAVRFAEGGLEWARTQLWIAGRTVAEEEDRAAVRARTTRDFVPGRGLRGHGMVR